MSVHVKIGAGGFMEPPDKITIESTDRNNLRYEDEIVIATEPYDKPRTITIMINGKVVWQRQSEKQTFG